MRRKSGSILISVITAVLMVLALIPVGGTSVYAEEGAAAAPGGQASSNDADALAAALGGTDTVEVMAETDPGTGASVLTGRLKQDIALGSALKIQQGKPGDRIVIDLGGHTVTGPEGASGADEELACGGNAIEIAAGEYDVEITDSSANPGALIGGRGAVYETGDSFRSGAGGGCAVCFTESAYYPYTEQARLNHGLTVSGGVQLAGGKGADVSSDDMLWNIEKYTGSRSDSPEFSSGSGGAGIGQIHAGELSASGLSPVYARIDARNGRVSGGDGGLVDMHGIRLTAYAMMTNAASVSAMSGVSAEDYDRTVGSLSGFFVGKGGDGIRIGCGRKYINIGEESVISGGSCGSVNYGKNQTVNQYFKGFSNGEARIGAGSGNAGSGIAVWVGDFGLTRDDPEYSGEEWRSRTADSDDMGIYVAGTVMGGNAPDACALNEDGGDGGAGIALYGDYDRFGAKDNAESHLKWGILDIEGKVVGGKGGSALAGAGGDGGDGIYEDYSVDYNDQGTDHYIINGLVQGGNGGSSFSTPDLSEAGSFGLGGNGMVFLDSYRSHVRIEGSGRAMSGDAGDTVDRKGSNTGNSVQKAIYLNPLVSEDYAQYYENTLTIETASGSGAKALKKSQLTVNAGMEAFSSLPGSSTSIDCGVKIPAGYTGSIYVQWIAELRLQENDPEYCGIEPVGTDGTSVHLRTNKAYKYLAYEGYEYQYLGTHEYNLPVATTDRIKEVLSFRDSTVRIYCNVLLEDGRWGSSNVIKFDKSGWKGGPYDPAHPDQIVKFANPLKIKAKKTSVSASKLKKRAQTLGVKRVIKTLRKGKGTVKYTLASAKKGTRSYKKYFKVNAKTGKVTIKKGLKKGTYKVRIRVTAAGNANYKKAVKTVSSRIIVK